MVLWILTRTRSQAEWQQSHAEPARTELNEKDVSFASQVAQEKLSSAILLAHRAAQILRDFRERYGLKVSPAWLLQLQAVTAGVLLADPELSSPTTVASPTSMERDGMIRDSHTAFDEVFRCLLGTGVEVMIARGIARMMYHTAQEQDIAVSRSTREMLTIMSHTAWRPSDLSLMNSRFPNFATIRGKEKDERLTEMLSRWEKLNI